MRTIVFLLLLCGIAHAKGSSDCQQPSQIDPFDARPICGTKKDTKPAAKKPATKPATKPVERKQPPPKATCQPRDKVDPFDARPVCSDTPKKPAPKLATPTKAT